VSGCDGLLLLFRRIGVLPCLEELSYVGQQFVGALIVVNGARPPRTPEFRSQVPNGSLERPAEYRSLKFLVQLLLALGVGEVSPFTTLEERGTDLGSDVCRGKVDKGVLKETNLLEEESPAVPGAVVFLVPPFGFRIEDSIFRVIIREIQEEIWLGSGTISKFFGTCAGKEEMM
jgi:hypothetical protein